MSFILKAIEANQEISELIKSRDASFFDYYCLGAGGDRSLGIDLKAEEIFFKKLRDYGYFYSEESGVVGEGSRKIVLDPIDGSDNFSTFFPYFGTSAALIDEDGTPLEAVICNLANQDIFIKTKEFFKQGKLFSDDFHYVCKNHNSKVGIIERAYLHPKIAYALANNCIRFRSPGAMALSLAYVYESEFLLFIGKTREFDVAAGLFMVEDLHKEINDKYLLVSKEKNIFDKIKTIVEGVI